AVGLTIIGFLIIQFTAIAYLASKLFNQEIHQLLYDDMEQSQNMGHFKVNLTHLLVGTVLLGVAYWIVLYHLVDFGGLLLFVAVACGCLGTIFFMRGFGKLLGLIASLS